ncbi:hypothetical protein A5893_00600 [Pedobacter psychrophilus]|uniref:DUF4288 domain-containing protein n=1 Tax=Pedobacter psychrophilus TaxID=1826909 RepID=A0A179DL83_9SPHI|nr:DUF4288 domain-containing protein [Pedobacter psychrophilus]OAQ41644.1 hypothetical protein A5893_00600 [Pedobacter psychrophilus]
MNWFVAKMIFQIEGSESSYPQFDEQLRLIDAINEELALEMAHQLGYIYQDELKSNKQTTVKWKFVAVTELEHLGNLEHGKEIHYHIVEPDNLENYLCFIDEKANALRKRKTA